MPLDLLTVLVMLRVWLRGRYFESFLAGTLTTLLVVPHVLWYDWVVLLGVAPFAAYANRSLPLVGLLLALHAAISFDSYMIVTRPVFDAYPIPTPLLAAPSSSISPSQPSNLRRTRRRRRPRRLRTRH